MDRQAKLEQLAREILTLSRNTLLVNLRFLDRALSQFQWIPVETGTLQADGQRILFNPRHVLSCYKTAKEIPVRDYLHMVLHCVFQHMYVSPTVNRPYWNLACDMAVENIINELSLPATAAPRANRQSDALKIVKAHVKIVTAEKIYAYLQQAYPNPAQLETLCRQFSGDDHAPWYMTDDKIAAAFGLSNASRGGSGGDSDEGNSSSNDPSNDGDNRDGNSESTADSRAAMAEVWRDISQRMQTEMETFGKQRGMSAGAMIQGLAAVNREKYDYTTFLKKFAVLGERMKLNEDEFDYVFYTYGLQLYKNLPLIEPLEYKEVKSIREFVIAIDTSGSTSGRLVQTFVQKTYNILMSAESFFTKINLHILQCDANIQEDAKITSQEDFERYLKTMQILGHGGTDFRPVFEYVDKLRSGDEFSNLKGLIYFTDGFGAYPARKPDYEVAFVFVEDGYSNPEVPPWAIKLVLQEEGI